MIQLYHGSYLQVSRPDLAFSRSNLDFGKGFYATPVRDQAERWADRARRRYNSAILNIYRFDLEGAIATGFSFKEFPEYDEEWLDFVMANRRGVSTHNFDIVRGGVANDKVFNTIELYFGGLIDKEKALDRLKFEHPNQQICILNEKVIADFLAFESAEEVSNGSQ